ncbi:MAG TPA: hypothetical protein PLP01_06470 [Phycisphaerae bacterium]|nr:hypothetical protein [Phycisphaerae bacterium]HOI54875.1 hypothetical protein [Phycisphaerae bacterium]
MASRLKAFLHSPLKLTLAAHLVVSLATGVVLVVMELSRRGGVGRFWMTSSAGPIFRTLYNHADIYLWLLASSALLLAALSLAIGLVFGRWGQPPRLQGRAMFWVPPLTVLYVVLGVVVMGLLSGAGARDSLYWVGNLLGTAEGLVSLGLYAALMTLSAGLGWLVALAVADHRRRSGKWETIGYVE